MGALLVSMVGALLFQTIYSVSSSGYTISYIHYDRTSILSFLLSFKEYVNSFFAERVFTTNLTTTEKIIGTASIAMIVITAVISEQKKKSGIFLAGILFVISAYSMFFLTGLVRPPMRILITFSFLIAFCVAFLYTVFHNSYPKVKFVIAFIAMLTVFNQSREINQIFYSNYQRYQIDVMLMESIWKSLMPYSAWKPVYFVGYAPSPIPFNEVVGQSPLNLGRVLGQNSELFAPRLRNFIQEHGLPINMTTQDIDLDELRLRIHDMPNWPQDGFVREFEEYIIVRLGPSTWD